MAQQTQNLFEGHLPQYKIEYFTAHDGLSQGSICFMYRDSRHFMWFSSYEGLNRFDSKHFKVFLPHKNDTISIKGSIIFGITEDKFGNMWIGTEEGLNCLNHATETFKTINNPNNLPQQVHPIYADSINVWYVGSLEGLVCYNFKKQEKKTISREFEINNNFFRVFSTRCTPKGDIWSRNSVSDRTGLIRYNSLTHQVERFFSSHRENQFGTALYVFSFCLDRFNPDVVWLGTKDGVLRFDTVKRKVELFKCAFIDFNLSYIHDIQQDVKGTIWLGTDRDGFVLFDPKTKGFQKFNPNSHTLNQPTISNLYADPVQDIMWANSESIGIIKITPSNALFQSYHNEPLDPFSLNYNTVRCFTEDQQKRILIGTMGGGINVFDHKNQTFKQLVPKQKGISIIPDGNIFQMCRDGTDKIWIGTHSGLVLFNENTQTFQLFKNQLKGISTFNANTVTDILVLPDSLLLLNTDAGLFFFNTVTKNFKKVISSKSESILALYHDMERDIIYIGTDSQGYLTFKYVKGELVPLSNALNGYMVSCFLKYKGLIWAGTNKGLFSLDENNAIQKNYTIDDGLPSNCIYGCQLDNKNNLWLSSNRGLSCFNVETKSFKNFTPTHGLQGYEYNVKGSYKTPQGALLFGGINGFDFFYPDSIVEQKAQFPIYISDLKINNESYKSDTVIREKYKIDLNYIQNTLQISFQALNYFDNANNSYRFKLMPFDTEWHFSTENSVIYAQLPPNDYTFIVEHGNSTETFSGEKAVLHISIHPPFWATVWFRILLIAAIISTFVFIFRNRIKQIKLRETLLKRDLELTQIAADRQKQEANFRQKLAETEMTALRSQMNPHFIFNVLNSINDYMLNHDASQASQYLTDFSKLIRLVLENSRSEKVTLSNEMAALALYMKFEQLRFEDKLRYTIEIDPDIDSQFIKIPPLLIQPYVENAIWHGLMHRPTGGNVLVRIKQIQDNLLHIDIEDDGIGRAAAAELKSKSAMRKKSFGMTITSERIQLVNEIFKTNTQVSIQDLVNTEGEACGTKVVIEIPC